MERRPGGDQSRAALGRWGEQRVARWYVEAGYEVLDRNWRGRGGELDLVVGRAGQTVFCEVKTRSTERFGAPAEAVDHRKQRRIRGLAVEWMKTHGRRGEVRFDVASVVSARLTVLEAAF